ncbi:probable beta transducin-like protein [Fusarium torulosum]|uniref:Probable beta transducin-like protein n=1 Tax=Fusarium torulosum TaxID=33205 RepID=A0AAE8SCG7_9HYPO|nr:probable beta transducin-like protein [Fusarium torulosum]
MRLLNIRTFRLESFNGAEIDIPQYAILSHTWGDDEITFQDITQQSLLQLKTRESFSKIQGCCTQARRDALGYVWIDTCCIDKTSSAELSEAINSMFKWYQQATLCYVFLKDFSTALSYKSIPTRRGEAISLEATDTSFFKCRWFTRGWTLQELIAPRHVDFFNYNWIRFGSRDNELLDRICQRTGVWPQLFDEPRCDCTKHYVRSPIRDGICQECYRLDTLPETLDSFAVSIKMSWASSRVTTRKEDAAYCLLGLFNLNMPMLYGEGDKAFSRLQQAIIRQSKDQSLLLWRTGPSDTPQRHSPGCLAPSPGLFKEPVRIIGRRVFNRVDRRYEADFMGNMAPMELTDTAINTSLWICPCTVGHSRKLWLGILDLAYDDDYLVRPALLLEHMGVVDLYRRVYPQWIIPVNPRQSYTTLQLSLDHDRPSINSHLRSTASVLYDIVITLSLDEAIKKDIGILQQPSPLNAISLNLSLGEGPKTGPVYFLATSNKLHYTLGSGGSHPPFDIYASRATQIPSPWAFKMCQHQGVERYFGGIHFVDFTIDVTDTAESLYSEFGSTYSNSVTRGYVAIIWGMHRELANSDEEDFPWSLWCRAFDMYDFINYARTSPEDLQPSQLYLGDEALSPAEIQQRMESQRQRLCLETYEKFTIPRGTRAEALFPNSCAEDWSKDFMGDITDDPVMSTQLSVTVAMVEGLGRRVFELHVKIDPAKRR